MKRTIKIIASLILFLVLLEVIVRLFGIKPFRHIDISESVKYIEKSNYNGYMCNADSIGIIPCETAERTVYQADKIPFKVTHLKDGSRYCGGYSETNNIILLSY